MGIENCRECGKPVSTEAKTCPNCGARKPTKTTGKTRWGMIVLVVLAIGIISRGFSGRKTLDEQAAAKPECQVKMANGILAASRCDLMTLCTARIEAGNEYSDILRRYKNKDWLDGKLDEQVAKIDNLSAKLQQYTKEDLQKWCGIKGSYLDPMGRKVGQPAPETAAAVGGSCVKSPIAGLPMGEPMNPGELTRILDGVCPGASFGADGTVIVEWEGKRYQVSTRMSPRGDSADAKYELTSIKSLH